MFYNEKWNLHLKRLSLVIVDVDMSNVDWSNLGLQKIAPITSLICVDNRISVENSCDKLHYHVKLIFKTPLIVSDCGKLSWSGPRRAGRDTRPCWGRATPGATCWGSSPSRGKRQWRDTRNDLNPDHQVELPAWSVSWGWCWWIPPWRRSQLARHLQQIRIRVRRKITQSINLV